MKNSFIAIDFETANSSRASACQIGLVKYVDGKIVDTFESLIKPHPTMSQFDGYNVLVHGINAADVRNSPEFDQLWNQLSEFIDTEFLVAHNAGFDMSVFRGLFDLYELTYPEIQYLCTMMLSRNLVKPAELNLKYVAKTLGVDLTRHHNALDDAMAAGGIAQALISQFEVEDLLELSALAKIRPGKFSSTGWRGSATRSSYNGKDETLAAMRERLSSTIDSSGPLSGYVFVLTGTIPGMSRNEAHERIVLAGGSWSSSVTKKVSFLVEGDANSALFRDGEVISNKSRAVYELREQGYEISILDAQGFLSMISP